VDAALPWTVAPRHTYRHKVWRLAAIASDDVSASDPLVTTQQLAREAD